VKDQLLNPQTLPGIRLFDLHEQVAVITGGARAWAL
jgi:hypothetical protein